MSIEATTETDRPLREACREAARQGTYETTTPFFKTAIDAVTDTASDAVFGVFAGAVAEKLEDMQLHDETGDPMDEGYMAAVNELRAWLAEVQ